MINTRLSFRILLAHVLICTMYIINYAYNPKIALACTIINSTDYPNYFPEILNFLYLSMCNRDILSLVLGISPIGIVDVLQEM